MPSPFPGMDPYLENAWGSFHTFMISAVAAQLNQRLPDSLVARVQEDVSIESPAGAKLRTYRPDVDIVEAGSVATVAQAGTATTAAPVIIPYPRRRVVRRGIRIIDPKKERRVVTAMELLSPSDKRSGKDNRRYRQKLRRFEDGSANWVEFDLLRSSRGHMPIDWTHVGTDRGSDYLVLAYRASVENLVAYPVALRQRLPVISVPLRKRDADVALDLQAAFDRAYEDGRFRSIDYSEPCDPPLSAADAAWFAERLAIPRTEPGRVGPTL